MQTIELRLYWEHQYKRPLTDAELKEIERNLLALGELIKSEGIDETEQLN